MNVEAQLGPLSATIRSIHRSGVVPTNAYNDSGWAAGPAQLGYGDGDEATVVGFGPDPNNKYVTTWFRRAFTITNPGSLVSTTLKLLRDDGAIVHLNGNAVYTSNMPAGPVFSSTLATARISNTAESLMETFSLAPSALLTGVNLLAVEIHQAFVDSSDISFDLSLCGWP